MKTQRKSCIAVFLSFVLVYSTFAQINAQEPQFLFSSPSDIAMFTTMVNEARSTEGKKPLEYKRYAQYLTERRLKTIYSKIRGKVLADIKDSALYYLHYGIVKDLINESVVYKGKKYSILLPGENVAGFYLQSASFDSLKEYNTEEIKRMYEGFFNGWMNSSGHRDLLLQEGPDSYTISVAHFGEQGLFGCMIVFYEYKNKK